MSVVISINQKQLDDLNRLLKPKQIPRAMQAAISRTITTGVKLVAQRIGEEVRLKQSDIKKTITAKRGSFDKPSGSITIGRDKQVWLGQFLSAAQLRPRIKAVKNKPGMYRQVQRKGGVSVAVRKKPTPKYPVKETHPHAFITYALANRAGVFERTGTKKVMQSGRYKGKLREQIRRKRGPTPLGVFLNARGEGAATVFKEVEAKLTDVLQKNVASQISRFLNPRANDRFAQ